MTEEVAQRAGWRLTLVGAPRLEREGREAVRLERKLAAVLAYLALSGPTTRERLGELLWPDVPRERARNSLRQALHRLRALGGTPSSPAIGTTPPSLRVSSWTSLRRTRRAKGCSRGAPSPTAPTSTRGWRGSEIVGLGAPECGRHRARAARERRCAPGRARARRGGGSPRVRPTTRAGTSGGCGSTSCSAIAGRGRALRALRPDAARGARGRAVRRDPGARGPPRARRAGSAPRRPPASGIAPRERLPVSVLRPPVLAGRAREWAQLERAWEAGQLIYLEGEAGVGKSRLAQDFAASRGAVRVLEARPGDCNVPYSSAARFLRKELAGAARGARHPLAPRARGPRADHPRAPARARRASSGAPRRGRAARLPRRPRRRPGAARCRPRDHRRRRRAVPRRGER